jgi:hypothetical protein
VLPEVRLLAQLTAQPAEQAHRRLVGHTGQASLRAPGE